MCFLNSLSVCLMLFRKSRVPRFRKRGRGSGPPQNQLLDRRKRFSFIQEFGKIETWIMRPAEPGRTLNRFLLVVRYDRPVREGRDDYRSPAPAGGKRERSPCSREPQPPVRSGSSTSSRSFTPDGDKDATEPPTPKICEHAVIAHLRHSTTWRQEVQSQFSQVSDSVPVLLRGVSIITRP